MDIGRVDFDDPNFRALPASLAYKSYKALKDKQEQEKERAAEEAVSVVLNILLAEFQEEYDRILVSRESGNPEDDEFDSGRQHGLGIAIKRIDEMLSDE